MIFAVLLLCEVKDGGRRGAFTFSLKEGLSTGGWAGVGGEEARAYFPKASHLSC